MTAITGIIENCVKKWWRFGFLEFYVRSTYCIMNYSVSCQQIIVMKEWDELHEICLSESCNLCPDKFSKILFFFLIHVLLHNVWGPWVHWWSWEFHGHQWIWHGPWYCEEDILWYIMLSECYLFLKLFFQLNLKYLFQDVDTVWNPRVPGPRNHPEQGSQQSRRLVVARHPHLWNVGGVREPDKSVYTCNAICFFSFQLILIYDGK